MVRDRGGDCSGAVSTPRRPITVAGPSIHDPRLWIASVVITLQVLGQTLLHFDVSIAQILVAILTSTLIEVAVTFVRRHTLIWPASAMLTGNGIAFVLRVPGTQHGDWWSMQGACDLRRNRRDRDAVEVPRTACTAPTSSTRRTSRS